MVRAAVFGDFDYDSISQHPTGIILYFILKLFFSTLLLVKQCVEYAYLFLDYIYCCH